jgi:hypothetical protein
MKVVKLKKPKGDPHLIDTLVRALNSARAGKLKCASICLIADRSPTSIQLFCGSSADGFTDTMVLVGLLERAKNGLLQDLRDQELARYNETGSFDPDPAA